MIAHCIAEHCLRDNVTVWWIKSCNNLVDCMTKKCSEQVKDKLRRVLVTGRMPELDEYEYLESRKIRGELVIIGDWPTAGLTNDDA